MRLLASEKIQDLNHPFLASVDGQLRPCGFGKTGATELGGRFSDVKGGNFGLEQVAAFVLFNGHAVGGCPAVKNFGTPQVRVENGVWMEDVYPNVVGCPFQRGHPGKLSKGGLGC